MSVEGIEIGRVLRASTEGFTCGTRSQALDSPTFGAFVQSLHSNEDLLVIGVVTAIRVDDDPLVRQLIMASHMADNVLRDQRENRLVPVEIEVLNVGYVQSGRVYYNLPPRPPLSLDLVTLCHPQDIAEFTEHFDFLRLILNAKGVSTTDLLGAVLRNSAKVRHPEQQRPFLVGAGRHLAALLSHDLSMLQHILQMIRPT